MVSPPQTTPRDFLLMASYYSADGPDLQSTRAGVPTHFGPLAVSQGPPTEVRYPKRQATITQSSGCELKKNGNASLPHNINPQTRFYPVWIAVFVMVGAFAYWSSMHAELKPSSPTVDICVAAIEQLWAIRNNRGPTAAELANLDSRCKPNQTVIRR
jgi:hypothetical protein